MENYQRVSNLKNHLILLICDNDIVTLNNVFCFSSDEYVPLFLFFLANMIFADIIDRTIGDQICDQLFCGLCEIDTKIR